jgi:hypothetical protein
MKTNRRLKTPMKKTKKKKKKKMMMMRVKMLNHLLQQLTMKHNQ